MRIENSVTRATVRHHEASWVMPNSYPEWRHFQFASHNYYWFFFLHTLPSTSVFKLGYALFYQFYAKIRTFSIKKCSVWLLSMTSWCQALGHLTPPGIRRKYPEWVKITENQEIIILNPAIKAPYEWHLCFSTQILTKKIVKCIRAFKIIQVKFSILNYLR